MAAARPLRARRREAVGAVRANKTLAPNAMAKKIAEWFMVTCEKAGADAKEL